MIARSQVTISSDGMEPTRFDPISKASTSTGISYITLLYIKKNPWKGDASEAHQVRSNGKEYTIIFHTS